MIISANNPFEIRRGYLLKTLLAQGPLAILYLLLAILYLLLAFNYFIASRHNRCFVPFTGKICFEENCLHTRLAIDTVGYFFPTILYQRVVRDEGGTPMQNVTMLLHSSGYLYKSGSDGGFGILTPAKVDTLTIFREGYQKEKRLIIADKFNEIVLKKALVVKSTAPNKLVSLTQNLKGEERQRWFAGNETYTSIVENRFIPTTDYPSHWPKLKC